MEPTIQNWPVDKLVFYARNPRKNDAAVDRMSASIREFGFKIPVLARSNGDVVDGHLRLKAARKMGIGEVPVILCDEWTEAQVKAFRLMVNRSVNWADWDEELLRVEFGDLKALGFDLSLTGFDVREIDGFTLEPNPAEDEAPPLPETPTSKLGDLWILGDHRILCGDSTDAGCVARLMDGKKANLMATDPPYLVDYTGGDHPQSWANKPKVKDKTWDAYNDPSTGVEFYSKFLALGLQNMAEGSVIYQWHADRRQPIVYEAWIKSGLIVHQHIIWVKSRPVLTRSHYMWQHEAALYGWPKGQKPKRRPPANMRTVWEIDQKGECDGIHPTQKPVELARRPIEYHTDPGGICYEPFSGSGTTIAAAQVTGRRCFAMELSPQFVDVAVMRWQNLSGFDATLDGDGGTFNGIKENISLA